MLIRLWKFNIDRKIITCVELKHFQNKRGSQMFSMFNAIRECFAPYIYIYIYMCVCVFVYIYIYIYIYIHTHRSLSHIERSLVHGAALVRRRGTSLVALVFVLMCAVWRANKPNTDTAIINNHK